METAIVMPLFIFIVLGILQLSLMHQARLLTKYAAYKATRAGSLNRADPKSMEAAAVAVMMPMLTRANPISSGSARMQPQYGLYNVSTATDFSRNFKEVFESRQNKHAGGKALVEVVVCHPLQSDLRPTDDFDDPDVNPLGGNNDWRPFEKTKLSVQVTTYYHLIIPFANAFIWWASLREMDTQRAATMKTLRMRHDGTNDKGKRNPYQANTQTRGKDNRGKNNGGYTLADLKQEAEQGNYIMPVRSSYSMRMHSNLTEDTPLNSENLCHVPFDRK